jgi:hypothetical protein
MDKTFKDIRYQSYDYFLRDGFLWKRPKRNNRVLLRIISDTKTKNQILKKFHDIFWAYHREIWAIYHKIKKQHWWKGLNKDVEDFVASYIQCQLQSKVRYRDELHPTYPLVVHFQWVINLVTMLSGLWSMKYLVLARK